MSVAARLRSLDKPVSEPRAILGSGGNIIRVSEEQKCKIDNLRKAQRTDKPVRKVQDSAIQHNVSIDSCCSSNSSSSGSSAKLMSSKRTLKRYGLKSVKVSPDGDEVAAMAPELPVPTKRCDWITRYSDPVYIAFHDEEWGFPIYDDRKLHELLVFSQALAELSWPTILHKRDLFRKAFDDFHPSSIAQFTEKKLLTMQVNGVPLLSEPKLRAIVENAKQLLKVQQEFGSFGNYCWRFVNNKPVRNGFRYARQVPVKTPKAELMSKDLMRRGFRCVGPTVIYSFMQVSGIVNDHLVACFRYQECSNTESKRDSNPKGDGTEY